MPLRSLLLSGAVAVGVAVSAAGCVGSESRSHAGTPAATSGKPGDAAYQKHCAVCHGADGRGSWRSALFLVRPGDLTDGSRARQTDGYLFDLIKQGGSPIGRPGMPGFAANLSDEDIRALIGYLRGLAGSRPLGAREPIALSRGATAAPGRPERWGAWGAPGAPHEISPPARS